MQQQKKTKKMRLPKSLKLAINTYYAVKYSSGGMFPSSEVKEECVQYICDVADQHAITASIVPGVVFLRRGDERAEIHGPFLPIQL